MRSRNFCSFYDLKKHFPPELSLSWLFTTSHQNCDSDSENSSNEITSIPLSFTCAICDHTFTDRLEQMNHFQGEWHLNNLKLSLEGKSKISEEEFDNDSHDHEETDDDRDPPKESVPEEVFYSDPLVVTHQTFFHSDSTVFSFDKTFFRSGVSVCDCFLRISSDKLWVILLTSGGRFSGAVFNGSTIIAHKTFHRYVVRAKRGGVQSVRDAQQHTKMPKSAGATLRRYNEKAFAIHIKTLLTEWKDYINNCHYIFIRYSTYQHSIFFHPATLEGAGSFEPLSKKDPRLHSVPFTTHKPTLEEVKRVHQRLSTVYIYGDKELFLKSLTLKKLNRTTSPMKNKTKNGQITKTKEKKQRKERENNGGITENYGLSKEIQLHTNEEEVGTTSITLSPEDNLSSVWKSKIYTVCKSDEVEKLKEALSAAENENVFEPVLQYITNSKFNPDNSTLLHKCASFGSSRIVLELLRLGCDPTFLDKEKKVPFQRCANRETRQSFMRFRGECEAESVESYDWNKAQIPNLNPEEAERHRLKIAEKRKIAKAKKKIQEKTKREAKISEEKEQSEREEFLKLTDREKRAIAAERRLAQNLDQMSLEPNSSDFPGPVNIIRCYQCALDIKNRVPFHYSDYNFCTMECLKNHKQSQNQ